jgi:hypothetical protein
MAEAVMGTVVAMKAFARGDEAFKGRSLIEQFEGRFGSNKNKKRAPRMISDNPESRMISDNPLPNSRGSIGRPNAKRLKSFIETRRSTPVPNSKKGKSGKCGFCGNDGHNITKCESRKQWGSKIRDKGELSELTTDLGNPVSTRFPAERLDTSPESNVLILDSVPPQTEYLSIEKKFVINDNLLSQSETNLCVRVACLGAGGVPLRDYETCYIKAGKVRDWLSRTKDRYKKVFSKLGEQTFAR